MIEIPKRIGKIMNAHPVGSEYISTGVHKRHYWMVDHRKAWSIYNNIVNNLSNKQED